MEPQRPNVPPTPEENTPDAAETTPQEQIPVERHEQVANPEMPQDAAASRQQQSVTLPPVTIPDLPDEPQGSSPATTDIDAPAIADDVDVIEKDWVDRAKQILEDTKDDPHAQEEAIEKLQIEYLRKRYGKEIKQSE